MTPRQAASTLGRLGAQRRHQATREPVREKARAMRAALGLPDAPGLAPELLLTSRDRL